MKRRPAIATTLLACVAALLPAGATAQYWSFGISLGGGTTVAAHMGMHLGNTDDRRESGLTGGTTEVELVIGLSRFVREGGSKRARPGFGLNLRETARSGVSAGLGFRLTPPPPGATGGYRAVIHVPVGFEPYPLPAKIVRLLWCWQTRGAVGLHRRLQLVAALHYLAPATDLPEAHGGLSLDVTSGVSLSRGPSYRSITPLANPVAPATPIMHRLD